MVKKMKADNIIEVKLIINNLVLPYLGMILAA